MSPDGGESREPRSPEEQLEDLRREYWQLQARYIDVVTSPGHKLLGTWGRLLARLAPAGTRRAGLAYAGTKGLDLLLTYGWRAFLRQLFRPGDWWGRLGRSPGPDLTVNYNEWLADNAFRESDRPGLLAAEAAWALRPLISVVIPVHDPDPVHLNEAISSVKAQVYPRWEICLADDASQSEAVRAVVAEAAGEDRTHSVRLDSNRGISAATNAALQLATGEYIAFLDHDDVLHPDALHRVVEMLNRRLELDLVYSDEDHIEADGGLRLNPFIKPDWSPELLKAVNYVAHLCVVRASLLRDLGGLRSEFDGAQDHDLALRVHARSGAIARVPGVLYSWRRVPGSTSTGVAGKPWAFAAAGRALDSHLAECHSALRAEPVLDRYRLARRSATNERVSIIIPTKDQPDLLERCLESINRSTHGNLQVVLVDNGSSDERARRIFAGHNGPKVSQPGGFNFPRLVNAGAAQADGDFLLLLNNDIQAPADAWIDELLIYAEMEGVGAVGARLLFPDGQPQHEGIGLCAGGVFAFNIDWRGYMGMGLTPHNCSAVSAACMMTPRSLFNEMGGFDERLPVAYNDVDYCQRLIGAGHRIVYTPYATLTHVEAASRSNLHPPSDEDLARERWGRPGFHRDPFLDRDLAALIEPFNARQDRRRFLGNREAEPTDP